MSTVIRFVVLYRPENPSAHTIESIILGVGFTQGGHFHSDLMDLYSPERKIHDAVAGEGVYAGYLHVDENKNIQIYPKGGSGTLRIDKDEAEDNAFVEAVERSPKLKMAIVELYPLIATSKVANVLVSSNQKSGEKLY